MRFTLTCCCTRWLPTDFERGAACNPQAQRGHSRDHRPDRKQVNLALVVTRDELSLGHELFAGNRNDVTTLREIVEPMGGRYGAANWIWVLDRGPVSKDDIPWLKHASCHYIAGTPKCLLRRFERVLAAEM